MPNPSFEVPLSHRSSIRYCIALAKLKSENRLGPEAAKILDRLSQGMSLLWDGLAQSTAATLPPALTVRTDSAFPGYVYISEHDTCYAIPFFMAEMFPKGEQLAELKDLSKKIRVKKDSTICLSGSGCSVGSGLPVADLDYCEYLSHADTELPERLVIAAKMVTDRSLCLKVTVNSKKIWRRPWSEDVEKPTKSFLQQTLRSLLKSKHKKVDYLAKTKNFGVLEVTNKLIFLDFMNSESGEAQASFSMQEVPVDSSTWVPRSLGHPIEVGRYVSWLFDEVRYQLEKARDDPRYAIKALRRAMILSRILLARNEMSKIYQLLSDENGARLAALNDRCALYATLEEQELIETGGYAESLIHSIMSLRNSAEGAEEPLSALSPVELETFRNQAMIIRTELGEVVDSLWRQIQFSS